MASNSPTPLDGVPASHTEQYLDEAFADGLLFAGLFSVADLTVAQVRALAPEARQYVASIRARAHSLNDTNPHCVSPQEQRR